MAWRLESTGTRRIVPTASDEDGIATVNLPRDSSLVLEQLLASGDFVLDSDSPKSIDFGACGGVAHYIVIRVKGGYVRATVTSTLGTAALFVEPAFELRSDNNSYTALTLQRPAGVEVVVNVFLGKRSS